MAAGASSGKADNNQPQCVRLMSHQEVAADHTESKGEGKAATQVFFFYACFFWQRQRWNASEARAKTGRLKQRRLLCQSWPNLSASPVVVVRRRAAPDHRTQKWTVRQRLRALITPGRKHKRRRACGWTSTITSVYRLNTKPPPGLLAFLAQVH